MEGRLLGGRYELLQRIGGGGMAVVYKARDQILDRIVAIKVMNTELSQDHEFIRRFIFEAKLTSQLSHQNIVNVYDAGSDNGIYYMVMEYVKGTTLKEYIQEQEFLAPNEAVQIAMQICDALAHAHRHGVVHRDIKPHNIMCTQDQQYKVTDFGISRLLTATSHMTKTGMVMGSVHYFSPEQASGKEISYTSDIYSLGIVLFEMVTGQVPFDAKENVTIALKHLQEPVPDPRLINPEIPDSLVEVIEKALNKNPAERFQSAEEMKNALQRTLFTQQTRETPTYTFSDAKEPNQYVPYQANNEETFTSPVTQTKPKKWKKRWIIIGLIPILAFFMIKWFSDDNTKADEPRTPEQMEQEPSYDPISQNNEPQTDQSSTDNPQEPDKQSKPKKRKKKSQDQRQDQQNQDPNKMITYKVVAGTFQDEENAFTRKQDLENAGISADILQIDRNGRIYHQVVCGVYQNRERAQEQLTKVQNSGIEGTENAYIERVEKSNDQINYD